MRSKRGLARWLRKMFWRITRPFVVSYHERLLLRALDEIYDVGYSDAVAANRIRDLTECIEYAKAIISVTHRPKEPPDA